MISISISCEVSELPAMREVLAGLAKIGESTEMVPAHRPITAEDDAKIWDMYSRGVSVKDISEELALPWMSVRSRIGLMTKMKAKEAKPKACNPPQPTPTKTPPTLGESDQAILDLMKQGLPAIDIAARLGRTIGGPWTPDAVRARIKVLREASA